MRKRVVGSATGVIPVAIHTWSAFIMIVSTNPSNATPASCR